MYVEAICNSFIVYAKLSKLYNIRPLSKPLQNQRNPQKAGTLKIIKQSNYDGRKNLQHNFAIATISAMRAEPRATHPEEKAWKKMKIYIFVAL